MEPDQFARVKDLLLTVAGLSENERRRFLDDACKGDPELRREIDALLAHDGASSCFFRVPSGTPSSGPGAPGPRPETESLDVRRGAGGDDAPILDLPTADRASAPQPYTPAGAFRPGAVLDNRYRIDTYLASGGMGQVYRAHDIVLDVPLALKTIRPEIAADPRALRRFKQEVLLARSVTHQNVCRIFDIGHDTPTDVSFLTMEFLEGEALSTRIQTQGALAADNALPLVIQMADALDAAHRAGVVHRDFKSANVMVVPAGAGERAVITDFGLAMTTDDAENTSRELIGTPAYMSPEQVAGGHVGPASDLYALGVVLYEMCTGRLPFCGATPIETARAHVDSPPPRPSDVAPVEARWEAVILRLLAKTPGERFASAHAVVAALEGRASGTAAVRYAMPTEHDAFVGRSDELAVITRHLEDTSGSTATPLLTLLGTGGAGKTRLALHYGWERLEHWPGGIWFCDLSEARSLDGVVHAVATALDVPLGKEDPVIQVGNAILGRGRCLVILDNFEQVTAHAEETLGRWLVRAPAARFLVTSRERLALAAETVLVLDPLDPATDGVRLFTVRARMQRPGFALDATTRSDVEAIAQQLDGLPLAIELAAARLRLLTLGQLRERLADRFKLLAGGARGRHQTIAAALDWSWVLLTPWEQSAIAQASVFEGGFTLEAAEAVIDLSGIPDAPCTLDVVQSLVDKSWLRTHVVFQALRFGMYTTVQEYASARLREHEEEFTAGTSNHPGSMPEVEVRHGAYYAEMGADASIQMLDRHGGVERGALYQLELENLVAACHRAIDRRDEATTLAAYAAARAVLDYRGPLAASIRLGLDALSALREPSLRGRVLFALGSSERLSGKVEEAHEHLDAALAIYRGEGDRSGEAKVLGTLGNLHHDQGEMEQAREHYEAALAIHREVGNVSTEGMVLGNLGVLHFHQGRMEEARRHYEAALAIHREVGAKREEGGVLGNLGVLHFRQGRMGEAREHYEAALSIHRKVGNVRNEGMVLGNLGVLHMTQGRAEEAHESYEAALAIHRRVGQRSIEGVVLLNLGDLHHAQGQVEVALRHYEAALAIHREVGDRRSEGMVHSSLGDHHREQGQIDEAREHYEAALSIHREVGNRRSEGVALGDLGDLCLDEGKIEEARTDFALGIRILRDLTAPIDLGKLLCSLGELEARQENHSAARAALAEAESIADALTVTPESKLARRIDALRRSLMRGTL